MEWQTFYASPLLVLLSIALLLGIPSGLCALDQDPYAAARTFMIENDLKGRDIHDPAVLRAMGNVPRHLFVDEHLRDQAYNDYPLPIGEGQTISQPYIVAFMTQTLGVRPNDKVLEIGTGSGYQAAVLAEMGARVYSIEIHKKLADRADRLLASLGYKNITVKAGDGFFGFPEHAPFDAVILTCAPKQIPRPLIDQLREGGKMIAPVGGHVWTQNLVLGIKKAGSLAEQQILPVRFVPMTGEAEKK